MKKRKVTPEKLARVRRLHAMLCPVLDTSPPECDDPTCPSNNRRWTDS